MISVYNQQPDNNMTVRDEESIKPYVDLIQWGRQNPVQFIENILEIHLMDYQKYIISMSWIAEWAVWVCSRNAGKSFLAGVFLQAKALLYPKSQIQILSAVSRQANETFGTLENIAKHQVKSLISNNSVFCDEVYVEKADTSGWTHNEKKGHQVKLLNGSWIRSVNGSTKTVVGKRANVMLYDEAGIISREFFNLTEPFAAQSSGFKTGSNYDPDVYPKEAPNCRVYIGSATDTNSMFYEKYREAFKRMLIGDTRYFAVDLDCEVPLHPTMNGKPVPPLLTQEEIDRKMRENEIAANREYHNIFDRFDLEDCVVSRADVFSNTQSYLPHIKWGGKKHRYVISYDPAAKVDNAPVLVTEVFKGDDGCWKGKFVHMENLVVTYGDGSKRPMRIEEQVDRLRQMIYEYNGRDQVAPYENVTLLLDAGSGGQGSAIAQYICQDWVDANGVKHPGLYDENSEYMRLWAEKYPHAVSGHMLFLEPSKYRTAMFEATKNLVGSGHIVFPPSCPKTDILVVSTNDSEEGEEKRLSRAEMASLIQMDLMKEEMIAIARFKSPKGVISYGLPPDKARKMHDDRNYCAIMACWFVDHIRQDEEFGDTPEQDYMNKFIHGGNSNKQSTYTQKDGWSDMFANVKGSTHRKGSPFGGKNPFGK